MTTEISAEARNLAARVINLLPGSMSDRDRAQALCQNALTAARNSALEDAAVIAENTAGCCASEIRAMKVQP